MIALTLCLAALPPQDAPGWRYVVPAAGDPLRRPALRALPLSAERPAELEVEAEFQGAWQRYGSLRFGDADSTRVAVVLDHHSATAVDLYVDGGRDLRIDERDRIEGDGARFELSLAVATRDAAGDDVLVPRRVAFELGPTGAILGVATLGWLEGQVEVDGKPLRAVRRDGDANGFFGDAQDQLWLDRDGSGEFAPLQELFVVQPILTLDGRRYALRTDRLGSSLRLDLLEGAGRVRLALPGPDGAPRTDLVDVQALLVGRDGSAALVRAPGEPTEVPIGEYRLTMVTLRVTDAHGAEPWSFVFSEAGAENHAPWRVIDKDEVLELDPLGGPVLGLSLPGDGQAWSGGQLSARVTLHTGDGLLINTAYRGREAPVFSHGSLQATVVLIDAAGRVVASGRSGFA